MNMNHSEVHVSMTVPNSSAHLRLVRLVVASLASDLGFGYDEVEDLRIVADEIAHLVMESTLADRPVALDVVATGPELRVKVSGPAIESQSTPTLDPLASEIVGALVASHTVLRLDGRIEASFQSRPPVQQHSTSPDNG